jgi:hypothetical protein
VSIQSFVYQFFGAIAFIDKATGNLTKDGSRFLLALWNRTGAGTGIVPKVSDPLTATGADVGTALMLKDDWNVITAGANNAGVVMLALKPGNDIQVMNKGPNTYQVYPFDPAVAIDALGAGAAFSLAPGKLRIFEVMTIDSGQTMFIVSFGN